MEQCFWLHCEKTSSGRRTGGFCLAPLVFLGFHAMCRDLEGLAHICIQPEYSEKGQTPFATFHVWGIQIKPPRANFSCFGLPFLILPFKSRKLRTQPRRQDERT